MGDLTNKNDNFVDTNENKMPITFKGKYQLAQALVRSELIPPSLKGQNAVDKVFAILTYGDEFGLSPWVSIRNITVINGVPAMGADLMKGLVFKTGDIEHWKEWIDGNVEDLTLTYHVQAKRKSINVEMSSEFSLQDAKRADLLNKDNWRKYPKEMLRARAVSKMCRMLFPEVLSRVYDPDELDDIQQSDNINYEKPNHYEKKEKPEIKVVEKQQEEEPKAIPLPDIVIKVLESKGYDTNLFKLYRELDENTLFQYVNNMPVYDLFKKAFSIMNAELKENIKPIVKKFIRFELNYKELEKFNEMLLDIIKEKGETSDSRNNE